MFDITLIPPSGQLQARLQVSGEATIQNIQQFKTTLAAGIEAYPDLTIDCSNVTVADLSCLQLLCSAHRSCQTIKLTAGSLMALKDLIESAGFCRLEGCGLANDKQNCLWIGNHCGLTRGISDVKSPI